MVLYLFEWCYVQAIQFYLLQNNILQDWFEGFLDLILSKFPYKIEMLFNSASIYYQYIV